MNRSVLSRLLTYLKNFRFSFFAAVFSAIVTVAASLAGPLYIGKAIDQMFGIGKVSFTAVLHLLLVLAIIYGFGSISGWFLTYLSNDIAYNSVNQLRRELFNQLNHLPVSFFDTTPRGDTISRFINDMDAISDGLLQGISILFTGVFTIVGSVGFMLWLNPTMTLVVLASAPVAFFVARFVTRLIQRMFRQQAACLGNLNGYIEELISGQEVVRAFSYEEPSFEQFKKLNDELNDVGVRAQFYSSLVNPSTRLINNLTYAVVGIIGSISAIQGHLTIGEISSFLIYSGLFARPFNDITAVLAQFQSAFASAQRIFYILDLKPESPDAKKQLQVIPGDDRVTFKDVDFSYTPSHPLITGLNLVIQPGSRIAIVGHTGAGKTTLVNLLMRYYDVNAGSISIDGDRINDVSRNSLRRNIGMVPQETWLFSGTIRENIAYGKPNASEAEVIAAAKAVNAHAFILRLPYGYETHINDAGDDLSQGQKQLLTIARVMLVNPPMLILDEATSNIDTRTEQIIQKAFDKLSSGKTSFIIAHRLSTIQNADLILVMDKGNIIESGTHQQLLALNGAYTHLYNSQFAPTK